MPGTRLNIERPSCPSCGSPMGRAGATMWKCRCGKTKREPSTRPAGRPKKAKEEKA